MEWEFHSRVANWGFGGSSCFAFEKLSKLHYTGFTSPSLEGTLEQTPLPNEVEPDQAISAEQQPRGMRLKFSKNPFPGMNPWLEEFCGDIQTSLTTYARHAIQPQLPADLVARVEEYLAVDESTDGNNVRPRRQAEPQTLRFIEIVDLRAGRRVITAIEFLSLANKLEGIGKSQYVRKQTDFLSSGVSLVEIDLMRQGEWVIAVEKGNCPTECSMPYRICVTRGFEPDISEVDLASYRHPLPQVRIPLRQGEPDVLLPVQSILDDAYVNGRYGNLIDYCRGPAGPMEQADETWIRDFLSSNAPREA